MGAVVSFIVGFIVTLVLGSVLSSVMAGSLVPKEFQGIGLPEIRHSLTAPKKISFSMKDVHLEPHLVDKEQEALVPPAAQQLVLAQWIDRVEITGRAIMLKWPF